MKRGDNVQWIPLDSHTVKTGKVESVSLPDATAEVRTSVWVRHQNRRVPRTVTVPLKLLQPLR